MKVEENAEVGFLEWFNGNYGNFSCRSEWFYGDCEVEEKKIRKDLVYNWVRSAYLSGYELGGALDELAHKTPEEQLGSYKSTTIETAEVGDTLEDGSIVLKKENGIALLVAPASTEVKVPWTPEFVEVFLKLKEQGFDPSQFFIPTKEQLLLAYKNIPEEFSKTPLEEFSFIYYWSSTEYNTNYVYLVNFATGNTNCYGKTDSFCVRAFRWVTY